jgi:hypothetical protein
MCYDFVVASGGDFPAQVVVAKKGHLKGLKNNFGAYIPDFRKIFLIIETIFLVERLYGISNPRKAIKYLMTSAATYSYEAEFTVFLNLKSKKRNKLEVEDDIKIKLRRQYTYNVARRCARGTIVAVEMHYYSKCSLRYPAMYMRHMVICGLPGCTVFFHIISF